MSTYTDDIDTDTLEKAERECLTRPSNSAMWDERLYTTHGPVMAWAERGDDVLSESNYLRVLEDLQAVAANTEHEDRDCCWDEDGNKIGWGTTENPHDDDVIDATISDWLVGSLRQIFVRVRDEEGEFTPAFRESVAISLALRDYPVYDESDFSEREWEAAEKMLEVALEDAENAYSRDHLDGEDVPPELHEQIVDAMRVDEHGVIQNHMPEILWGDIVEEYAAHADRISTLAWEIIAREIQADLNSGMASLFDTEEN